MWAWERIPAIAPQMKKVPDRYTHAYGDRWGQPLSRKDAPPYSVGVYRDQLTNMTVDQVPNLYFYKSLDYLL